MKTIQHHTAQLPAPGLRRGLSLRAILACMVGCAAAPSDLFAAAGEAAYDVIIIGGTPAGIAASIAAGRAHKKVIVIEQSPVLGGMLASGVLRLDDYLAEANSGVMEDFRLRVRKYHRAELANDPLVKEHLKEAISLRWNVAEGRTWEPKTAARIYAEMVAEVPTVATRFNEVAVGVKLAGDRVVGVVTRERDNQGRLGRTYEYSGRVIIDATYEGDLAAFAGVPFRIGREARSKEEPHAGLIYTDGFCNDDRVLKGTIFPGSTGVADDKTQAFTFRVTAKDFGRPDHPFRMKAPPPGYDPAKYKWNPAQKPIVPNGKFDMLGINWGADLAGHSTRYVLAGWEERVEVEQIFRNHSLGWLYYIQTEGGSPNIGLADDEFTDNGNLPYRLYVRQGRRIEGYYTLTESDVHKDLRGDGLRGPLNPDSVAIAMYPIDSHNVQNPTDRNSPCYGLGAAEGTLHLQDVTGPYQIPYGVMVPRNRKGLLFPVAISSTHVAMSSVRMEPPWSALGQAAGIAAVLALDGGRELNDVPVGAIQDELLRQRCILFFYKDLPGDAPGFEAVQKLSLRGALDGDENYYFRPDQPITLGEFARLAIKGLGLNLSISAAHFADVPRSHSAFKFIETLYDYSTQSAQPFLDYEVRDYLNYWWGSRTVKGPPAFAYPDRALTAGAAARIVAGLLGKPAPVTTEPRALLSRREAAELIYRHSK